MRKFELLPEQVDAVDFEQDMVVAAMPGSGKTTVLSEKIRRLLPNLPRFQGVVAISFTNKASDELERRCKLNAFDVKNSFFGTIDQFCLREIIRPFASHLMAVQADNQTVKLKNLPALILQLKGTLDFGAASIADIPLFLPFLEAAIAQGLIPLEAVGMLAYRIVDQSSACQRYLKARYRAVFIDEYQDSGYFQHQLFMKLKAFGLTAVAVGDVDQSIYAFANKDARYLQALRQQGSGFETFEIVTNHRSHPSITDFARRLLNPSHQGTSVGENRVLLKSVSGDQTAIAQWLRTGIPNLMRHFELTSRGRIAILCRHEHSASLIGAHLGLPNHVFENSPFNQLASNEASILADLLKLRYDLGLAAETLIDHRGHDGLNTSGKRSLRQSILRCRTCAEADLAPTVGTACSLLLGRPLSAQGVQGLRTVCAASGSLQGFRPPAPDEVQVMTLHKAKGLEFDVVFHVDLRNVSMTLLHQLS